MTQLPWLKWRPDKWRNDKPLQACSLAARGLWHELCMIAHDCEPYGHVRIAGTVPTLPQLAQLVGCKQAELKRLLAELEAIHIFSRWEDGAIYSRRMVRDEAARLKATEDGRRGGNPSLLNQVNGRDKGHSQIEDKAALARALARSEESESQREDQTRASAREVLHTGPEPEPGKRLTTRKQKAAIEERWDRHENAQRRQQSRQARKFPGVDRALAIMARESEQPAKRPA